MRSSSAIFFSFSNARAADHGDGPSASNDPSADIGDLYFFLDPNDNSRAILTLTMRGFIIPSEAVNMGIFDPTVVFRLLVEGTGDAAPDATINVTLFPAREHRQRADRLGENGARSEHGFRLCGARN